MIVGGIITFTPEALYENPFAAVKMIQQIVDHPTWDCYLLPSVVGMAAKASCNGSDAVSDFKE